ncbi:hypothetical protein K474DRAFT_1669142, partial [Panus rudis PR-1116 ss-1]
RSEPYDPYLPRGGSSSGGPPAAGNSKTAAIQAQIDDTVGIMRENITKVAERGERLDQLQDKTGRYICSLSWPLIFPALLSETSVMLCANITVQTTWRFLLRVSVAVPIGYERCVYRSLYVIDTLTHASRHYQNMWYVS